MVIYAFSIAAKIMSLYSITKGKVKSRSNIDGDLRLKMPRYSEFERGRAIGIIGGASHNAAVRQFNVHQSIV